ncbi:unnamed protein product, partial [Didymodactylos carnosus]
NFLQEHRVLFDTSQPRTIKTKIQHVIDTGDHSPVNAKPYFKTIDQRKNVQQETDKIQAANKLKQVLTEEPLVLKYPHPTAPFILATDASELLTPILLGSTSAPNRRDIINSNHNGL